MATGVGLRIAEDECTAAIVTDAGQLDFLVRDSILHMAEDGDTVLGGDAPPGSHSITGFVGAVGNPAGLSVDDGEAYRAEDLFATALFCLINQTTEFLSGPAEFYATHPGEWSPALVQSSREALDYLGLRSVVLVSEADLPAIDTAQPGRSFAYDAARAALAAVLATPAGATPPDPANSENATVKTDVIPTVAAATALPQAYSQAMPAAAPLPTEVLSDTARADTVPPAAPAAPVAAANQRRTPLLIAVAALFGLALGGLGVAVVLRGESAPEPPPVRDAQSDQSTPAAPPPPLSIAQLPTAEPTIVITGTTEPEPTTTAPEPPPPEPVTTTAEPTTTAPSTTSRTTARRSTTRPWFPTPPGWMPTDSDWTPPTFTVEVPPIR
ncbi:MULTISPECIES: hypothetical protein [Nocardia]|uniref:hypothetical protein n=1 Tax=Nocardia TaxID=1817 RepID=UPI000D68B435|nr:MULTISPECIES: hypothetical protein [Nocardia]